MMSRLSLGSGGWRVGRLRLRANVLERDVSNAKSAQNK